MLCHEFVHALAHDPASSGEATTRVQRERQAEAASFVALLALGLYSSRSSLPCLTSWASGDEETLLAEIAASGRIARDRLSRTEATAA